MKTTEFVEQARNLDFITKVKELSLGIGKEIVLYVREAHIASVYIDEQFLFTLHRSEFITYLSEEEQKQLYKLITEYAETPVAERCNTVKLKRQIEEELTVYVPEGYEVCLSTENNQGVLCIRKVRVPIGITIAPHLPVYLQFRMDNTTKVSFAKYKDIRSNTELPLVILIDILTYVEENKALLFEVWQGIKRNKIN